MSDTRTNDERDHDEKTFRWGQFIDDKNLRGVYVEYFHDGSKRRKKLLSEDSIPDTLTPDNIKSASWKCLTRRERRR